MIYTVTLNPAIDRAMTVPSIEFDTVLRATTQRADAGGKGLNVSRMVAQLGGRSVALGFAGGHGGSLLRALLAEQHIETALTEIAGETRTNVSIVERGRYVKVNESGGVVSAENQATLLTQISELTKAGDWWVLAGSLPPGVSADFYARITEIVQQAGGHVLLDASGEALVQGCAAKPDMVKPNSAEAAELTGHTDPHDAAQAIHQLGIPTVIISLGAEGVLLSDGTTQQIFTAPTIEEANPIGAGDAMVGGLVWGLDSQLTLHEALRWAIACGAVAASLDGTAFGNRQQIEAMRARIS